MAFKGDLRNVQLADLLQTLAQNRQEGILTVTAANATHRVILSREGVSLLDPAVLGRRRIGEILVFAGLITEDELAAALRDQAKTKKFLGELLIATGQVPKETLDRILTIQVDEELFELFRSGGGTFEFTECDVPSLIRRNGHAVRPLAVEHVALEAARRMDEWSEIERVVPSIDGLYLADCRLESVPEDDPGHSVLARLDGRHTVRDVADALLESPFAVAKVLAGLIRAHRARPASREELFLTARELLTEGQKSRSLRLLHRLAQLSPEACPLDAQLAEMFKLAGDSKAAAHTRFKLAEAARAKGRLDVARAELEAGLKESPGAITLLHGLVALLRETGDHEAELLRVRELSTLLSESGNTDAALVTMERLLELAPDDSDARRNYSDLCLRAHLKEKAVEVLERDAARLKREGRVAELPAIYKRLLSIDSGRKDIKRLLAAATRSRIERWMRSAGAGIAGVGILALCGVVGWRSHVRSDGLATIEQAGALLDAGDPEAARRLLADLMANEPMPDVAQPALIMLDQIDETIASVTRSRRSARDEQLSTRLTAIQKLVDAHQYDVALTDIVATLKEKQEAYLADRVRTRLQAITQEFLGEIAKAKALTADFRMPTRDADVAPAFARLADAFPIALITAAGRVGELAPAFAGELEGDARNWLHQMIAGAESYLQLEQRMRPELDVLRTQHERLQRLKALSEQYVAASQAAEAGDVARSRELLRQVLADYGNGELAEVFQERITRLDAAAAEIQRVDRLVESGDIEGANAAGRALADQYRDLQLPTTQLVPIGLDSLPHGAQVRIDGRAVGKTPLVLRLTIGTQASVEVSGAGRAPQRTTVSTDGPARCMVELPRRALAGGRLELTTVTAPIMVDGRFAVAGRDGSLQSFAPTPDGTLTIDRLPSGALSGAMSAPVAVDRGFIVALWDGRVLRVAQDAAGLTATWTRPLEDQLAFSPVPCDDTVAVVGASGRVTWLALADGAVVGELKLDGRVTAAPLALRDRLLIPLVGGDLASVALATKSLEWRHPLGHDLEHGLAGDDELVCAPTSTGRLLILGASDGALRGSVALGESAVAVPRAAGGIADVPLGKRLVRVDLRSAAIEKSWDDLASTGTPALIDDRLWLPCDRGVVEVIDLAAGERYERAHLGSSPLAGSPLATDLGIALLARDGSFVLLER